jgi:hypothetical protein
MSEEVIKYQCCICKKTVSSEERTSHLDPCSFFVISNIDEPRNNQKEQQFFCHFECFRKIVNDDGNLYIMGDDFPTMGEIAQEDWSEEDEELLN